MSIRGRSPVAEREQKWLGAIPMGWAGARLLEVADAWPSNVDKHTVEGQVPVRLCNYVDVYRNDSIVASLDFMAATATRDQIQRFQIRRGDTLITKDSETADDIGVPAFVEYEADDLICGYHLAIVRPNDRKVLPRYLYWALNSMPIARQWGVLAAGVTRVGIRSTDINKITIPLPPRAEQRAIADFLDRETAQIDALVTKQEEFIRLLRERRAAVVAKHLAPAGHWTTTRIKYLASTVLGKMLDAGRAARAGDVSAQYVRAADVLADGRIRLENLNEMPFSEDELRRLDLKKDDIFVVEGGSAGRPGYLDRDAPGIAFQKTVNRIRTFEGLDPRFAYWSLLQLYEADYYPNHFGAVSFLHVTSEKLREIPLDHPGIEEQREISRKVDERTGRIDALIAKAEELIRLARERRSALVTAAVTGQIDVRKAS
ncbi:restriction endonuclease subunit S [Parenemella sanctibonifatiensis]|uniref:Type I restriction modification DNA specificity domain-containing protein n=1 Tax=Parenemella sanctibonifatiensis TaxID=2016505 RepID=A0A255E544_9ACTN|nr:restriction endonuclease subunit S [Parenemella sanctibonifatiensis]OYN86636.1 hypothetical protein CGZ92_09945 [Parenemella sanctibonifatiensis]